MLVAFSSREAIYLSLQVIPLLADIVGSFPSSVATFFFSEFDFL
jgi:hypothetical protein